MLSVLGTVSELVSCDLWCYPCFLLFHVSNKFNWVASPNLHAGNNSSWRNNTVRGNDGSFLDNSSFKNNRVLADVCLFLQDTWIQSASVINNDVVLDLKSGRKSVGSWCSSVQYTIVSNKNISMNTCLWKITYTTELISPLMTVPCQILTLLPI